MKNLLLLLLLFPVTISFAGKIDSTFQRHQFSISMTNAMSHEFYATPHGPSTSNNRYNYMVSYIGPDYYPPSYYPIGNVNPNYSFVIKLSYSIGLSKYFRIETGINYQLSGYSFKGGVYNPDDSFTFTENFKNRYYIGSLSAPLYFKFRKPIKGGAFICKLGPTFFFPIHEFGQNYSRTVNGTSLPDHSYHTKYTSNWSLEQSSLGFDLKMGYEKILSRNLSLDIGPVVSFGNLLYFKKGTEEFYSLVQSRPYQYYIGLDVTISFGLKK